MNDPRRRFVKPKKISPLISNQRFSILLRHSFDSTSSKSSPILVGHISDFADMDMKA
jgi:hypothetical protein